MISDNAALDGVRMQLNSKDVTPGGDKAMLLLDDSDDDDRHAAKAPPRAASRRSERIARLAVRCACVRFAPDGRSWAAASTEGLLLYALDEVRHQLR